jgi:hypothetical protein
MRRGFLLALATIAAVNIGILLEVGRNRALTEATLVLDERELVLVPQPREHSEVALAWHAQRPAGDDPHRLAADGPWLGRRSLEAIGFDCSVAPGDTAAAAHYGRMLPRRAVIVFEIGGPSWSDFLTRWQHRALGAVPRLLAAGALRRENEAPYEAWVRDTTLRASRLLPVDAGLDAGTMRGQYPDRSTHLVLMGVVALELDRGEHEGGPSIRGRIVELLPGQIVAPRQVAGSLRSLAPSRTGPPPDLTPALGLAPIACLAHAPRYEVQIVVGRALLPRLTSIRRLGPEGRGFQSQRPDVARPLSLSPLDASTALGVGP